MDTNPYCLRIKAADSLRRKCVQLKQAFVRKVLSGKGVTKSTCYCGVTEYVLPITYSGIPICMVAATGFCGELSYKMHNHLCQRTGLTPTQLMELRGALLTVDREAHVICSLEILAQLLERYITEETQIPALLDTGRQGSNDHILRALDYISKNFAKQIGANAVANHCHLNTSYLQHLFCSTLDHGVAEEIRLCRLSYAKELLCTTEHSVKYIAFLAGFSSADYFSTVFKRHLGVSPLQYRRIKKHWP